MAHIHTGPQDTCMSRDTDLERRPSQWWQHTASDCYTWNIQWNQLMDWTSQRGVHLKRQLPKNENQSSCTVLKIFQRKLVTKLVLVPIDFIVFLHTMEVNRDQHLFAYPNLLNFTLAPYLTSSHTSTLVTCPSSLWILASAWRRLVSFLLIAPSLHHVLHALS